MEFLNNHLSIRQTPEEYYHDYNQAVVDSKWEDTTRIKQVKEQDISLNPFRWEETWTEYEAWVDTVSDMIVQYNKVYSDFINVLPRDIDHRQNYRGQYYKVAIEEDDFNETYICYDSINKLEDLPNFKLVRCNNTLTMLDEDNKIIKYPCYLGVDISSTNDFVAKSGITPNSRMIIMVQANEHTMGIINNQRFMFDNGTVWEVEEINNFMHEEGTNGISTVMRIYVKYSPLLPRDNTELNICDYYNSKEEIINTEDVTNKRISVNPIRYDLSEGDSIDITYNVVDDADNIISQAITYSCSGVDSSCYSIVEQDNKLVLTNVNPSGTELKITFKSDGCEDVTISIWLVYLF